MALATKWNEQQAGWSVCWGFHGGEIIEAVARLADQPDEDIEADES